MSHVTDIVLLIADVWVIEKPGVEEAINDCFGDNGDLEWLHEHGGGPKAHQCEIGTGAFNYLDIEETVSRLRALPWGEWEASRVQVAIQDEHDCGFGFLTIYEDADAEPPFDTSKMEPPGPKTETPRG